jgi:galactokinase
VGVDRGLHATVSRMHDPIIALRCTTDTGEKKMKVMPLETVALAYEAQHGGFFSYAAGVAYHIISTFSKAGGIFIDQHTTTLPLKKGLSSSAALCVLVARAFNSVYSLGLTLRGEMHFAFEGERMTPSMCGKMDQAVAFGGRPVAMTHDGDALDVQPIKLAAPLHLVLVDLKASKDTVAILKGLQSAFPHPKGEDEEALAELLGPLNEEIVGKATKAMESGDVVALGALMTEAQQHFDQRAGPVCPEHLGKDGSPTLHKVLRYPGIQQLILGGKGVGSQGDGSAQLLCASEEAAAEVCKLLESGLGVECRPMTVPGSADAPAVGAANGTVAMMRWKDIRIDRKTPEVMDML